MGLDTSHNCWRGSYVIFGLYRKRVAWAAGIDLTRMEGHASEGVLVPWSSLAPDPIHTLLHHSDCDGSIPWRKCRALADRMESLLPKLGQYDTTTIDWIKGLRLAYVSKQNVLFR